MAQVMIAQWENEWISLFVLSVAKAMIAQWENKCISLSVLPAPCVQFPTVVEYSKGFFPGPITRGCASKQYPNEALWGKLRQRLSTPISAPLLTLAKAPAG